MSTGIRRPWQAVDYPALMAAFPPAPEYFDTAWLNTPDVIEHTQLTRLRERAMTAARVPFFAERWDAPGFDPRRINSLDDLSKAPSYSVDDIRKSIDAHPPWGDYQGVTPDMARSEPMRVFMSGGTTGKSRPTFYTVWDREVGASCIAARDVHAGRPSRRRRAQLLGVRPAQRRVQLRRDAVPLAQLCRAHHEHGQRHEQRAPGASSRSSTARPRS